MPASPLKGFPRPIQVKEEPLSDVETEAICKLCSKGYASEMALRNHVRMSHIEAYATGDPSMWTAEENTINEVEEEPSQPRILTEFSSEDPPMMSAHDIVAAMKPSLLTTLANKDVSYIILQADPKDLEEKPNKKKKKDKPSGKPVKEVVIPKKLVQEKRAKLTQPITGPFECVEPSTLNVGSDDGTCHQIFFSCCEYSNHVRSEHARRKRTPRCQVCERLLPLPGHTRGDNTCQTCGEEYQTPEDLQEHVNRAHVKNKRFECCVCHKRFTQQAGVQQHMRMHTGDRPYNCSFCPKAFTQKSGLEQHLRTHTKIKPYRCVICTKSFCQSVHLKQHIRTHTNVAPFQCGICEKRFKQSSHLNYHLKNHNPATMTESQREKYDHLIGLMKRNEVANTEIIIDDEQAIAEQSIQEEIQEDGSFDINDSMVYIEVDNTEYII